MSLSFTKSVDDWKKKRREKHKTHVSVEGNQSSIHRPTIAKASSMPIYTTSQSSGHASSQSQSNNKSSE